MYNILIVDDEDIEREGIEFLLKARELPLKMSFASNGEDALELFLVQQKNGIPFDIVITDIKMPFMDGLELSERIKDSAKDTIIIISSAYGDFAYAQKAIQFKVDDYILKPIVIDDFYKIITKSIDRLKEREKRIEKKRVLINKFDDISFSQKKKLFEGVLYESEDVYDDEEKSASDKSVIATAIKLIEESYSENISLEWLAEKTYLSAGYLSGLFKKTTGKSVVQYIIICRMEKAKELLESTNMKIVDICKMVGYNSPSYFGLQFKKYYHISPQAMRGEHDE